MLRLLQRQLEAVYQIQSPDIRAFTLNKDQMDEIAGDQHRGADEWVLVREGDDTLDLAVWVDQRHLDALQVAGSPRAAVEGCFRSLCAAVEGVSHFLLLIERARRAEPVRLLELEAQAEVDKFVCARLHVPTRSREWRARLFRDVTLQGGLTSEEYSRYREAGRLAHGLCSDLTRHPHDQALLRDLRRFWRASGHQRMERMRRLAA